MNVNLAVLEAEDVHLRCTEGNNRLSILFCEDRTEVKLKTNNRYFEKNSYQII